MSTTHTDRIGGPLSSLAIKAPCRVATTSADISTYLTSGGLPVIDGVHLVSGDRVLVKDQTTQSQNGIYVANTAPWARDTDFNGNQDVMEGTLVIVAYEGAVNGTTLWQVTSPNPITISTSNITFSLLPVTVSYTATSTSSVAIGTGSLTFATQLGKNFSAGQIVVVTDQANSSNYMLGSVTSYSNGSLVVNVTTTGGSGTKSAWNISISGPAGPQGAQGPQGAVGSGIPWIAAGGTSDVITAAYSPSITLSDGLIVAFRALAANTTTTPTFNPNGLGALTITKEGGAALAAGDIPGALAECSLRYNSVHTRWELTNPAPPIPAAAPVTSVAGKTGVVTLVAGDIAGTAWTQTSLTNNNQLSNGSNFAVRGDNVSEFTNNAGYLTSASSFAGGYGALYSYTTIDHASSGTYTAGSNYSLSGFSGTWQCMGAAIADSGTGYLSLFQRIA